MTRLMQCQRLSAKPGCALFHVKRQRLSGEPLSAPSGASKGENDDPSGAYRSWGQHSKPFCTYENPERERYLAPATDLERYMRKRKDAPNIEPRITDVDGGCRRANMGKDRFYQ